ncbi:hypothetical protein ACH4ZU_37090 [Streptomyces sp. NPDC020472]|uniref:hypothetical protein n=1 Tax=Streptomyces sp. NPDC020472 TaxID=3365075 RepID=UPI00378A2853
MSTARPRPLGPGPEIPERTARDPRALTAAERAAAGEWAAAPAPVPPTEPRPARRRLGGGPAGPGTAAAL